jgi:ribosomal protein S1
VTKKTTTKPKTMAELLARSPHKIKIYKIGEKISAKFLEITKKSASFDIGGKSEALIIEDYFEEAKIFLNKLKAGDQIEATVVNPENSEGRVLLSLRETISEANWQDLEEKKKKGQALAVVVRNAGEKGLMVEYGALFGFIPNQQLGSVAAAKKQSLVGSILQVKIIEIDKDKGRLLFSEKAVSEAEDIALKAKALENVKIGEIYEGKVIQITNFGAFVEITVPVNKKKVSIEGLVHVSEISWEKVKTVADVLSEGQKVKVKVVDIRNEKLALSVRQTQKDPWEKAVKNYQPEKRVSGEVVRVSDFGSFVQLEPGVEGLIHITKIPPTRRLKVGEKIDVYVEEVDPRERRISLGLVLTSKPVGYK